MTGERSNYVELLEAEIRRLQAEVVRLTRREDAGDSAIIAGLLSACRAVWNAHTEPYDDKIQLAQRINAAVMLCGVAIARAEGRES